MGERDRGPAVDLRHELRTPLHVIGGHVELLMRHEIARLTPEGRRSLGEIVTALRALETAVDEVLRSTAGPIAGDGAAAGAATHFR